jgi:hypothetical protein
MSKIWIRWDVLEELLSRIVADWVRHVWLEGILKVQIFTVGNGLDPLFDATTCLGARGAANSVAFDYSDEKGRVVHGDKTAWAVDDADLDAWVHPVGLGAINPHEMKADEDYLRVAACYDENGLKSPTS